jgi:lectin, mannose-binding 2
VFFDTYSNMQQGHQQYISVMINDGTQSYDHGRDGGDHKLAGCPIEFRGKEHNVFARLIYQDSLLRMYVDTTDGEWQECFILRSVRLPRGHYFGVTAATGDLADNHDIISIKVRLPCALSQGCALLCGRVDRSRRAVHVLGLDESV